MHCISTIQLGENEQIFVTVLQVRSVKRVKSSIIFHILVFALLF